MAIPDRALMECFYGPWWSPQERATMMKVARQAGATSYIYGPAADPHTGGDWRAPYGEHRPALEAAVEAARRHALSITWRVSPGAPLSPEASIQWASADDRAILTTRIQDIAALGFDRILVAVDDISGDLDVAAKATFGSDRVPTAAAHADVINHAYRVSTEAGLSFLACPTHYWGRAPDSYRQRLGELLDPAIVCCWTGPSVTSATIDAASARAVAEELQRPIWLWDNYPVDDWDGIAESFINLTIPRRLVIGPLRGRETALAAEVVGYGTNCGLLPEIGAVPAITCLQWANDPSGYVPQQAQQKAASILGLDSDSLATMVMLAGSSPVDSDCGEIARAAAAVLTATSPQRWEAAAAEFDRWAASLVPLTSDTHPAWKDWANRGHRQLVAVAQSLRSLHGHAAPVPAEEVREMEADRHSVAHGSLLAVVDWVTGMSGAGAPSQVPN